MNRLYSNRNHVAMFQIKELSIFIHLANNKINCNNFENVICSIQSLSIICI